MFFCEEQSEFVKKFVKIQNSELVVGSGEQDPSQRPRTDLNKRSLPRPKTTTA